MKQITLLLMFSLLATIATAQTPTVSSTNSKLDSLAKLSQRFTNTNQPDSLYALMGEAFKKQISMDMLKQVLAQLRTQAGAWTGLELQEVKDGVAHYKAVFKSASLNFYISQDDKGKIYTYLFKP